MHLLSETEQEQLRTACATAEQMSANGDTFAGQELLVAGTVRALRAERAHEPQGLALSDAWGQSLQRFVATQGVSEADLNELD
jgi:hypothetical protein